MVIRQVNYYFDTIDMNLVKNKFNMRVRHILKTDEYIFTVKIPTVGEANIELNQEITYDEFKNFLCSAFTSIKCSINKFNGFCTTVG